jgi:hypothetical protein
MTCFPNNLFSGISPVANESDIFASPTFPAIPPEGLPVILPEAYEFEI